MMNLSINDSWWWQLINEVAETSPNEIIGPVESCTNYWDIVVLSGGLMTKSLDLILYDSKLSEERLDGELDIDWASKKRCLFKGGPTILSKTGRKISEWSVPKAMIPRYIRK